MTLNKLVSIILVFNVTYIENKVENMPIDCRTIFVKGLPYEFKEDDIGDRFRKYGEIKAIRMT